PTHGGFGSPAGPSGLGAVRRGIPDRLRSRRADDHRATRAAGGHHHGDHRRSGVLMAAASKILKRLAIIVAVVAAAASLTAHQGPPPRRIISLVPATTEMLFAMGAADRIAGVSDYDRFPPEVSKFPRVGGLIDPNVERVISLRPDLVIVYDTQTDLKQQLERARIPMFRYVHRRLPDITE